MRRALRIIAIPAGAVLVGIGSWWVVAGWAPHWLAVASGVFVGGMCGVDEALQEVDRP